MSATAKPPPSYAPVYAAALYPELASIFRHHGYALACHGSLRRDFDLVAVPWVESPSDPEAVITEITSNFMIRQIGQAEQKLHGRRAWTLSIGHGECAVDLSFMPTGCDKLLAAVREHHAQRADDRCFLDDDKLYATAGLPPCDRRVGDKLAMLKNCERYIERRCEGGHWPSYAELEAEIERLRAITTTQNPSGDK